MIKLTQDSVGAFVHNKKYVQTKGSDAGRVLEYIGVLGTTDIGTDDYAQRVFNETDGLVCIWDCDIHLHGLEEYTPRRTDKEIIADLVLLLMDYKIGLKNGDEEWQLKDLKIVSDVCDEAKEMLKRMEGE